MRKLPTELEAGVDAVETGAYRDALPHLRAVIRANPRHETALYLLGVARYHLGRLDEARGSALRLLRMEPDHAHALNLLANIHQDQERFHEAESAYQQAIAARPRDPYFHNNLGTLLRQMGRPQEAVEAFDRALELKPAYPDALVNKGHALSALGRAEAGANVIRWALALDPQHRRGWLALGKLLQEKCETYEAMEAFEEAERLNPACGSSRWLARLALPSVYASKEEMERLSARFVRGLDALIDPRRPKSDKARAADLEGSANVSLFSFHHRDQDLREPQEKLGRYLTALTQEAVPSATRTRPTRPPRSRLRVGYVGYHFFDHPVGRLFRSWIEQHDDARFDVRIFQLGDRRDALTQVFERNAPRTSLPSSLEESAALLLEEGLDCIIYPELGLHAPAVQLASLRLAPLQCVGLGYPVTSGLENVDVFLSGESIEPEDGDQHYSERLVRLPGTALSVREPTFPEEPPSRAALGLEDDAFVFLSGESLSRHLPQHDALYARILAESPHAQLLFVSSGQEAVDRRFSARMSKAFEPFGVLFAERCRFAERRPGHEVLGLSLCADAVLDTPGWSARGLSLEAISSGRPIVTWPSRFMRGRMTAGLLEEIRVSDTVALSADAYVDLAVRLAEDAAFSMSIGTRMRKGKHGLFEDRTVIRAFERFLSEAGCPTADAPRQAVAV